MRLLIAGWQGQVAQALARAVPAATDVEACALGRPALDICEMKTISRALAEVKPDVVINTAAFTAVDDAEDSDAEGVYALNCEGAGLLAQAAAERGAAIIHLSTDYVYDGTKPTPYLEDDPTGPTSVYGRSKLAGEAAVAASNPRHLILRTAWVYSPFSRNFVKSMLNLAATKDELSVVDDQIGSPTYAPHLATAIMAIASQISNTKRDEAAAIDWGIYHCAGDGETSWCGLAQEVFATSGAMGGPTAKVLPITTADYPTKAQRPANSRLDCSKLQAAFSQTLPDWRQGVKDCVTRLQGS